MQQLGLASGPPHDPLSSFLFALPQNTPTAMAMMAASNIKKARIIVFIIIFGIRFLV
jgi:hypothetical protein